MGRHIEVHTRAFTLGGLFFFPEHLRDLITLSKFYKIYRWIVHAVVFISLIIGLGDALYIYCVIIVLYAHSQEMLSY